MDLHSVAFLRIAGNACYLLRVEVPDQSKLNEFLEELLVYASYRLHLVVALIMRSDEHDGK
ncbi:MAG: Lrp/AsnC ligand binding domain-containing protein [Ktedonobacteraceae bacterium]